jgi:hypothetical protein
MITAQSKGRRLYIYRIAKNCHNCQQMKGCFTFSNSWLSPKLAKYTDLCMIHRFSNITIFFKRTLCRVVAQNFKILYGNSYSLKAFVFFLFWMAQSHPHLWGFIWIRHLHLNNRFFFFHFAKK